MVPNRPPKITVRTGLVIIMMMIIIITLESQFGHLWGNFDGIFVGCYIMGWNFDEIRIIRKIRWVGCWSLEKWNHSLEVVFKKIDFDFQHYTIQAG